MFSSHSLNIWYQILRERGKSKGLWMCILSYLFVWVYFFQGLHDIELIELVLTSIDIEMIELLIDIEIDQGELLVFGIEAI